IPAYFPQYPTQPSTDTFHPGSLRHIANNENDLSEYWNSISQFFHSRLSCIVELVKDNGLTFIQFWLIECRNFHLLDLSRRGRSTWLGTRTSRQEFLIRRRGR